MKQSEIEVGGRYAAYFGGHNHEIGEVIVTAPPEEGYVHVQVQHPVDTTDQDNRHDDRHVATKALLGLWNSAPARNTKALEHVQYGVFDDPPTFAEHAGRAWQRVLTQRDVADRLTAVGIPTERMSWLGRGGVCWYSPHDSVLPEMRIDDLHLLLSLAENRRPATSEAWAWLVTDLTGPWQPGEPITLGGSFATQAQAQERADRLSTEDVRFGVLKAVRP